MHFSPHLGGSCPQLADAGFSFLQHLPLLTPKGTWEASHKMAKTSSTAGIRCSLGSVAVPCAQRLPLVAPQFHLAELLILMAAFLGAQHFLTLAFRMSKLKDSSWQPVSIYCAVDMSASDFCSPKVLKVLFFNVFYCSQSYVEKPT